jgi:hypothetical protein
MYALLQCVPKGPGHGRSGLGKFIPARDSLREFPDRGRILPELKRVNILSYREIQLKQYRKSLPDP